MYYFFLLLMLCLSSFAEIDDTSKKRFETILLVNEHEQNGEYFYRYLTENNIISMELSELATTSQGKKYNKVKGFYSYVDPNGFIRMVKYTADENGYHPYFMKTLPFLTQEDKDKVVSMFQLKPAYKPPKEPQPPGSIPTMAPAEQQDNQIEKQLSLVYSLVG